MLYLLSLHSMPQQQLSPFAVHSTFRLAARDYYSLHYYYEYVLLYAVLTLQCYSKQQQNSCRWRDRHRETTLILYTPKIHRVYLPVFSSFQDATGAFIT